MQGQYNLWIVALSYAVAVLASYLALELSSRVAAQDRVHPRQGLPLAAVAMGSGIWSMHFVGMLAFSLPIPLPYSGPVTFLSLLFAVMASYVALRTIRSDRLSLGKLSLAALFMGGGVALMHYTGMAALEITPGPSYQPGLLLLSILIAVLASGAAMWLCFQLKSDAGAGIGWKRGGSALLMGFAIWGMHYTGMAATSFASNTYCRGNPLNVDNRWLAATVALSCLLLLVAVPVVSAINQRLARRDDISIRRWSQISYLVNGGLLSLVAMLAILLFLEEDIPTEAAQRRHEAHLITDEVIESSNDLTRAIRAYIDTGDPKFEHIYRQILAIQNGETPSPGDLGRDFWMRSARPDGNAEVEVEVQVDSEPVSVRLRARRLQLTPDELVLIDMAERAAEQLQRTELLALNAVKGRFQDPNGQFSIQGQPDPGLARQLLFDQAYAEHKVRITAPLRKLKSALDIRTNRAIEQASRRIDLYLVAMMLAFLALMLSFGANYLVTRRKITNLLRLEERTRRFGDADYDFGHDLQGDDEISRLSRTFGAMHWKVSERTQALEREMADRQRAEDESLRFFRQSLSLLLVAGFDGRFKRLNPMWERVLGFPHSYLMTRPFIEFVHPDDRPAVEAAVRKLADGQPEVTVENRALCADGSYRNLVWTATPRAEGDGFYATGHDITERREIERALSQNEERFRRVVEATPSGMIMVNQQGQIVLVNSQTEKMFDYRRDQLVGQAVEVLLPERYRDCHPGYRGNYLSDPTARAMCGVRELLGRRRDGSEFPVEIGISPIDGSEGLMVLSSVVDITQRRQAERELRASEARLHTIVENLNEGVVVSSLDGQLLHFNKAATEMHGFDRPEEGLQALGRFPDDFELSSMDGSVWSLDQWPLARLLRGEALANLEVRVRRYDGHIGMRVFSYSGTRVKDDEGRPILAVLTISDVTERKRAEAERQQTQKLESVGRLAAGIAHEINSPVQFVNDCCHFVRDGLKDLDGLVAGYRRTLEALAAGSLDAKAALEAIRREEQQADLSYLLENLPGAMDRSLEGLQRVSTIVRSMKDFAHPDQKEQSHADLNRAISSTLVIARNEYKYVADLHTELGELPLVPCYLGDLNQAVLNLVVNSAHAIEERVRGGDSKGLITVRTYQQGDEAVIEVEDNGGGIPEKIRDRIFDPFFTTKGIGKGTGQGLAITRSVVVDKHHGRLELKSCVGQGTTFTLRLPLAGAGAPTAVTTAGTSPP
ncbi:MAG: PAS domain S-box protein [Stagnimonas sp.]|nr:PAS domain S-box protein [Stagnimonas sp.]